jgi:WD40 repeat protein
LVRFDPTGHKVALSSRGDNRLPILDVDSGAVLLVLTNAEGLSEMAWEPRSTLLVAGAWLSGLIYLWDTATGRQVTVLKGHQNEVGNVAFSPDGDILVSSGWDGMRMWHARTGDHLILHHGCGELGSFGPAEGAYGHSIYLSGLLELLSFAPGREARRFRASEEDRAHKHFAFSADGGWLAFATGEVVELFDARTAELLATLATGPPEGVCFQKNGEGLIVSGERGLFCWPIRPGDSPDQLSIGPPEAIGEGEWQQVSLSQDGKVFAACQGDHVSLFEGGSLRETARTGSCGDPTPYRYLSLSPDGSTLATGGWHYIDIRIWETRTGRLIKELAKPEWVPQSSPYPVFEPNGRSLIIAGWSNYRAWDIGSWAVGPPLPRSGLPVIALSHRGALLATCDESQTSIQLRDVTTGELLAKLQSPIPSLLTRLEFSPDDTQIAVAHSVTRELIVWDLRLLREDLKSLGLDWARPPYPPAAAEPVPKAVRFRVLTHSL